MQDQQAKTIRFWTRESIISGTFVAIILSALVAALLFYSFAATWGGRRGVVLGTSLFAQGHFLLTYIFGFRGAAKRLRSSAFTAGLIAILLLLTATFFKNILWLVSDFWGIMLVLAYFYIHYYENIFYFLRSSSTRLDKLSESPVSRRPLYLLLTSATLLALLPYADAYGSRFADAAIRFSGIPQEIYVTFIAATFLFLGILLWTSRQKKTALLPGIFIFLMTAAVILIGGLFLDFLGIVYLIVLWHFFSWVIFFVWRTSLPKSQAAGSEGFLLGYAKSGPLQFIIFSLCVSLPFVVYFVLDYDGMRHTFLYHPVYGQFAMFIWSLPHITFSFLPLRGIAQKTVI